MAENKKQRKNEIVLSQGKEKQQCQEQEAAKQEEQSQQQEITKQEEQQSTEEQKKAKKRKKIIKKLKDISYILLVMSIFFLVGMWHGGNKYNIQKEQLEEENECLKSSREDLFHFLKLNDCLQEVSYTKLDEEKVLFVNIPIQPEKMARKGYETSKLLPIFLSVPKELKVERGTILYVSFSGLDKDWTLNEVKNWSEEISFIPYRVENNTYYYWKLDALGSKYKLEFEPHNGDDPYYLTLWWPGN